MGRGIIFIVSNMNRRGFLKGVALAAVASAMPRQSVAALLGGDGGQSGPRAGAAAGSGLQLKFYPYELKLRHAFNLARSSRTTTPDVLVEISFDGLTGYGEASMPPYLGESVESVCRYLGSLNLGQFTDPLRIEEIVDYLDGVAPGNNAAKAAVDIALHDLAGKIMGQPWHRIWGLSREKTPCTSFTIGIDTPQVVRQKVAEAAPYRVLKVKMGLDNDRELVETIRECRPDVPLCVDANQGWGDREAALDMCHWLKERGCLFVEQPFDKSRLDDSAWLTERSPLPIIADEAVKRLADVVPLAGAYSGINIKLMKSAGMHEAYQMAVLARALGMKVMLGCMTETSCGVTAAAQLSPMADYADLDGNLLISNDCFDGLKIVDGRVTLPVGAGIGVVPHQLG